MDKSKILPIVEVYTCVQSEGKLAGVPHILIRTTGCTLRCQFSGTDFCDTWYTSWHPDKGEWSWDKIQALLDSNPQIDHIMISGGAPTMHKKLLPWMTQELHDQGYYITLETEGSSFVEGCHVDLLSLSPKLSNSVPRLGTTTPLGDAVTQKHIDRHEKGRKNYQAMGDWLLTSGDYQFKPVIGSPDQVEEIEELAQMLGIPREKMWIMAAGGSKKALEENLEWTLELCVKKGWNFVPRFHILIYDEKRAV